MACNVCDNENKKKVMCPYCKYNACQQCTEKYLLETVHEYHCMSCRKEWSDDFVDSFASPTFFKKYRTRTEMLLLEKEKTLLPQTQKAVIHYEQMNNINSDIKHLYDKIKTIQYNIKLLQLKKVEHQKHLCSKKVYSYKCGCPYENCKGYINSDTYACDLCMKNVCTECLEQLCDNHQCKEEILNSIKLINKECKSCPNCNTIIYRISGCDHMWCTTCHTHFNWNTLVIERGILHNPHYYEYMSSKEYSCSESVNQFNATELIQYLNLSILSNTDKLIIHETILSMVCLRETVYPEIHTETDHTNEDLRIKFLQNKINMDELKALIYKRHKHNKGYKSYRYILDTYFSVIINWIRNISPEFIISHKMLCEQLNNDILLLRKKYGFNFTLLMTSSK